MYWLSYTIKFSISANVFQSCVFRKNTNTGVLPNKDAVCPVNWKRGLIFGALNCAKMICSTEESFLKEVSKWRDIFSRNGYSNIHRSIHILVKVTRGQVFKKCSGSRTS